MHWIYDTATWNYTRALHRIMTILIRAEKALWDVYNICLLQLTFIARVSDCTNYQGYCREIWHDIIKPASALADDSRDIRLASYICIIYEYYRVVAVCHMNTPASYVFDIDISDNVNKNCSFEWRVYVRMYSSYVVSL